MGLRPAGCECRLRHEADTGSRNPNIFSGNFIFMITEEGGGGRGGGGGAAGAALRAATSRQYWSWREMSSGEIRVVCCLIDRNLLRGI